MTSSALNVSDVQIKRFAAWVMALAAVILCVMMPELAFAQDGDDGSLFGDGAAELRNQSETSLRAWWEVISTYMLWIGLIYLAAVVVFFKGQTWFVALIIWAVAAWGDKAVDWVSAL